ncbi:REX4, RNA exonuclease 4 [Nowakowskiella sp. JEL0078]|nr:REX4, RNA exonuclease 4 [Nowakowskiella sp. JEL0078]
MLEIPLPLPPLAIDCVRVLCENELEAVAQVCILDVNLNVVYKTNVHQPDVVDYRTRITGLKSEDLASAPSLEDVKESVRTQIKGHILVGHSLFMDFDALGIFPQENLVRDTQMYPGFQKKNKPKKLSLVYLSEKFVDFDLGGSRGDRRGTHLAIEDATVAMKLYLSVAENWEKLAESGEYCFSVESARDLFNNYDIHPIIN